MSLRTRGRSREAGSKSADFYPQWYMSEIVERIRAELQSSADEAYRRSARRFFKEEVRLYGVKTATVGKIAKRYWREVEGLEKGEILDLCEELLRTEYCEDAFIVSYWSPRLVNRLAPEDLALFERWIETYINNWAKCDALCNHAVGDFIERYPESIRRLAAWAESENRWLKRAAAVSLIIPARRGRYLTEVFEIADRLLSDGDDMVQKGYGWLLKEASRLNQKEVFDYVVRNKKAMPRTALRYAVELMPKALKSEAMKKDWNERSPGST